MRILQNARDAFRRFRAARPGERFMQLHSQMHRGGGGRLWFGISVLAGVLLILVGAALGFIPGVPGFLVALLGLGIIAAQVESVARWCDRSERALRRLGK
jgi:hypothetical protein